MSGLGWGAVMAGRAARFEDLTKEAQRQQQDAIALFQAEVLRGSEFNDPENQVFLGTLTSDAPVRTAAGSALTLASPSDPPTSRS